MANKPRSADIHPGPGFRVRSDFSRPPADLMRQFRKFATPDIADLLNRLYAVDPEIRVLTSPAHRVCGPALTVKVFPGDNLMVHKALDVLEPGDVIVVDASGSKMNAVLGDLISTKARHRGCAGFVIDGLVRDLPGIQELGDFPVFARGMTPIGPLHRGPGEINFPVCCGSVVVNPGDLIIGDACGVVVVPQAIAAELLGRLESHHAKNESYLASVRRGDFSNAWVDGVLTDLRCPLVRGDVPPESPAAAVTNAAAGEVAEVAAAIEDPTARATAGNAVAAAGAGLAAAAVSR
jgi:regulator of RNase E activity RraA